MSQPLYPPAGYPPGGMPSPYPVPMAWRTSGLAITSLVCGLLLCIPGLSGLLAIIFGITGISATKNPAVRGRGMAVAGLILGFVNFGLWGLGGIGWWQVTGPLRTASDQLVMDLAAQNQAAVTAECTNPVTADQLQQALDWFKNKPTLQKVTCPIAGIQNANGNKTGNSFVKIQFSDGSSATGQVFLIEVNGAWKINGFKFQ